MKVLILGGGGREHAIAWKLNQSFMLTQIFCIPGNSGTEEVASNVDIGLEDTEEILNFARKKKVDLTIVGPEAPLLLGIVDLFRKEGLKIVGPEKRAARLEGSKLYAKSFMEEYGIPTGEYKEASSYEEALAVIGEYDYPLVIKADGLASGKGVVICEDKDEAKEALENMMVKEKYGPSGEKVIIEEFLEGIETSILCFTDGKTLVPMVSSQDYKRIYDGNKGPNTGGMGTCSPSPSYTEEVEYAVKRDILEPTLKGMQSEGFDYRGVLFVGLMITSEGPKVLEYNVRFGDPETQVVLPRLQTDFLEIMDLLAERKLSDIDIIWNDKSVVCVVLASDGYPGEYQKYREIRGLGDIEKNTIVFHSGTIKKDKRLFTNGGRVLGLVSCAGDLESARNQAYRSVEKISFEGKTYRKDIGLL